MKKFYILIFTLIFLFASVFPAASQKAQEEKLISSIDLPSDIQSLKKIKILLSKGKTASLSVQPMAKITDGYDGTQLFALQAEKIDLKKNKENIMINGEAVEKRLIVITSSNEKFEFKKRRYSGRMIILNDHDGLYVINETDLETYLKGVVPSEMFPKWHLEALKAQAVISRTYAVFSILKNKESAFHVYDTVDSQVYGGMDRFNSRTSMAVDDTRGEVLTHINAVFPTFFHSTSGGFTTPADLVWNIEPHPSLTSVLTRFSIGSPHHQWETTLPLRKIQSQLAKNGFNFEEDRLIDLIPGVTDGFGRILDFTIVTKKGSQTIGANKLRKIVGTEVMRSTNFKIKKKGRKVTMKGLGWGHGVGLCQWSAKAMAEVNFPYNEILDLFYPKSQITQLDHV